MNFIILYILHNCVILEYLINEMMLKAVLMICLADLKKTGSILVLVASFFCAVLHFSHMIVWSVTLSSPFSICLMEIVKTAHFL